MPATEDEVGPGDIDYGNHIVGPNSPNDSPPVFKFPSEMTPKQWEQHMASHQPFFAKDVLTAWLAN